MHKHLLLIGFRLSIAILMGCGDDIQGLRRDHAEHLLVQVRGRNEVLSKLQTNMNLVDRSEEDPTSEGLAIYDGGNDNTWEKSFTFQAVNGLPFNMSGWLCRGNQATLEASSQGSTVTEGRVIAVDDTGRFRGNGMYGDGWPTTCKWFSGETTGMGFAVLQDGPCLCAEEQRVETHVEIVGQFGEIAPSGAQVCVARYGKISSGSVIVLSVSRVSRAPGEMGFEFYASHCVVSEEPPLDIKFPVSTACPFETATLSLTSANGEVNVYQAIAGSWHIESAGIDPDRLHVSHLDLDLVDRNGGQVAVAVEAKMPQILY